VGALAAAAQRGPVAARLTVCGQGSSRSTPLSLTLAAHRTSRLCVTATVSYRLDPVNRIPIRLVQGKYSVTLKSDDDGTVTRCFSKPDKVTVQSVADDWASSPQQKV
jgi:hypothetical protein